MSERWRLKTAALEGEKPREPHFLDSTIVRAHQLPRAPKKTGGQAIGRSRGGLSTKIHMAVDALGNPLRCQLTGGEAHDITQGPALIAGFQAHR